ncbi:MULTISPECIES: Ger(x)C family spore germination protein [Clostridium]|uniref:Ger(X)C family spore germination protein n=1 Tax=Clostridium frigoriphilum TaxID=443253 RepID=A0ABU7UT14_9CLOT|nr:Ger(x)C family spore germination protein [Clostridium sp. DSM 17811]MBU3100591.1 Ger(x)C family spore germination protein [Clostridium sp. DSM 17811]
MKRFICIFILIMISTFTTGCKGTKDELDKLAVAAAIGYDITSDGKYILTAQILNPQKNPSGSMMEKKAGSQQKATDVVVFNTIGDSISDCKGKLTTKLGKELNYGHINFVVVGRQLAESGIATVLDAALRGYKMGPDTPLIVTKGNAFDIIRATSVHEKIPANEVNNILRLQSSFGFTKNVSILDFTNSLSSKTDSPVTGVINLSKSKNSDETFELAGTAIFKKDKLIGFMDMNETRGMQWVNGKVELGYITTLSLDEGKITFEIIKSSSKIKPSLKIDSFTMLINVKEESNISEMTGKLNPMKNSAIMDRLEIRQNDAITNEIKLAIYAAQKKFGADIFGFGEMIYRDYPEKWERIKDRWKDIFPNLNIEIKVISSLKRPGYISKPMD